MQKFSLVFLLIFPLPVFAAEVIINEIAWMGSLPKSGETSAQAANNEFIELWNLTGAPIDLAGWTLNAADGSPEIALSGTIAASGYFLLERTGDDTVAGVAADQIYVGALSNSGEHLFLKNSAGAVVDEINPADGWPAGDNATKDTMQRVGTSWVTAPGTPRAANAGENVSSGISSQNAAASSTPSQAATAILIFPSIKASAGQDRVLAAGSSAEFLGTALGINDEPLEAERFLWNFGDGEVGEGRSTAHIFRIPGVYQVGLHISSGDYAASDYLTAEVVPNQLRVSEVISGEAGFIRLKNPTDIELDLGGWIIEKNGQKFFVPWRTRIGKNAEIALANAVTGFTGNIIALTLHYPNGLKAFSWQLQERQDERRSLPETAAAAAVLPAAAEENIKKQEANSSSAVSSLAAVSRSGSSYLIFVIALLLSGSAALGYLWWKKPE